MEPLLTVPEAAAFLKVSTWTVRELVRTGRLPCYRVGGQLRFDPEKIRRWLREQEGKSRRQVREPRRGRRLRVVASGTP